MTPAPGTSPVASPRATGGDDEDPAATLDLLEREAGRVTDAYEARVESEAGRAASWSQGSLRAFSENRMVGLCLRLWMGDAVGFAASHDLSPDGVRDVVARARRMAESGMRRGGSGFAFAASSAGKVTYAPSFTADLLDAPLEDLAALLRRTHDGALDAVPATHARVRFATSRRRVLLTAGGGARADTGFALSTIQCEVVHRDGAALGAGADWASGERDARGFESDGGPEAIGRRAAERAVESSRAVAAPAGRQRVLCDNVLAGLLAHESFGHLTEYDLVAMDWSVLRGRVGETFARDDVSVVDAPVVPDAPADGIRVPVDNEGTRGRVVRMLDHGVLRGWLHQRDTAPETGVAPTGNGRAMNARCPPIVRMRNTFFEPGDLSFEEALELLGDGVYLISGKGGAPASDGSFMFTAIRGYRVEGGQIREPLRSTAVSGNILDFLKGVEGLTRDFKVVTTNFGGCGKWGQSFIPVGIGGPHVVVGGALVGGRAA